MKRNKPIRPDTRQMGHVEDGFDPLAQGLIPIATVYAGKQGGQCVVFTEYHSWPQTIDIAKADAMIMLRAAAGQAAKYLGPEAALDIATGATVGRPTDHP